MNNEVKVEISADFTDSANKITNNVLDKPTKQIGVVVEIVLSFINNTIFLPLRTYNLFAENRLNKYKLDL